MPDTPETPIERRLGTAIRVFVPEFKRSGNLTHLASPRYPFYTIALDFVPGMDNGMVDLPRYAFKVLADD